MIEVGDTGTGMDAEFLRERLFKPFQTTKHTGMGIGAYESQQYVQELGGKLIVESAVGSGTRITVQLPLFESAGSGARDNRRAEVA
jgi:signal transduction histidine kinase